MTPRSIIIGLLGAIAIATLGFFNDQIIQLDSIVAGHQLPIAVIGTLVLSLVTINPLLFFIKRRWCFRPVEVAVITILLLVSCSIPSRGFLEQVVPALGLPAYHNNDVSRGWKKNNLLSYMPRAMLPADGRYDPEVSDGIVGGLGENGRLISLDEVPWSKWATCLTLWAPIFALTTVAVLLMVLIVYRQWANNERLRFPIAEVTTALIERDADRAISPLLRNKLLWLGLGAVLVMHVNNGLYLWLDQQWIQIPRAFSFAAVRDRFTYIGQAPWSDRLLNVAIFPVVIGFSYFLASEVSLSLGLTQVVFIPLSACLIYHGVDMKSDYVAGGMGGWQRFGSYLALGLMLVYTGRRYYLGVFRAALTFRKGHEVENYTVWAARMLILSMAGLVAITASVGLPWPLAILFFALMSLMFVVMTRINVETGLFFIQPRWQPLGVMVGFFGGYSLGPEAMVILGMLGVLLCIEPSQALTLYFANGLRIGSNLGLRPSRVVWPAGGTWFIAASLGLILAFWASYNYGLGTRRSIGWAIKRIPTMALDTASKEVTKLRVAGELDKSIALKPLERLAAFRPKDRFLLAAGVGMAIVLVFGTLRLRLSWWPLHPIMFLVWDTYPMAHFSHSFLIGYVAKTVIMRLGGHRTYQKTKPLMIGLIAGDLLGGLVWMVFDTLYYISTGLEPKVYSYFPK
jgi:hypothetical protein